MALTDVLWDLLTVRGHVIVCERGVLRTACFEEENRVGYPLPYAWVQF